MAPDTLAAQPVVEGEGAGALLLLDQPVSFWGGVDPVSGRIVEPGHPQEGRALAGRVMAMARAKGSSSSSSVLAELVRNGHGPAAILMRGPDLIVGLGCIVAAELYGRQVPVAVLDDAGWAALVAGAAAGRSARLVCDATGARLHLDGLSAADAPQPAPPPVARDNPFR